MNAVSNSLPTSSSCQMLTVGEASTRFGVHPNTLRAACNKGDLRCYRIGRSGHRRLSEFDLLHWLGVDEPRNDPCVTRKVVIYARVSSNQQAKGFSKGSDDNDLARQIAVLNKVAEKDFGESGKRPLIYSDKGSGLSFNRKGFVKLINDILAGKFDGAVLLVSYKDRLARFGVPIVEQICKAHDIEVIYTESEVTENEQKELADDLLSIITHFSARTYGARAAKRNAENISTETVALARQLIASGTPVEHVLKLLKERGLRTQKGNSISRHVLSKYLDNELVSQAMPTLETINSFIQFHRDSLVKVTEQINPKTGKASKDCRLLKKEMVAAYSNYCRERELIQLSNRQVGVIMKKQLGYTTKLNNDALTTYVGVALKK